MSAGWRRLAKRPIADHERGRVFAITAIALAATAVGLHLLVPPRPQPTPTTPNHAPASPVSAPSTMLAPRLEQEHRVRRVARRFLAGYLAYLYGHGPAGAVEHASRRVHARLAAERPRVSPATRRRSPAVEQLVARRVGRRGRWLVRAQIRDGGVASYPLDLLVAVRPRRGAVVVAVAED